MDRGLGNTQGKLEVELSAEIQPASSWAGGDRKNRKRCSELRFYSVPSPSASYSAATSNGGASTGAATDAGYRSRSVYVAGTDATYCLAFAPSTASRSAAPGSTGYGTTRARFYSRDGGYIARYAAYLDAYTGPGTATDSLGRYVPKVGTRGMCKKSNKHQLLHLSLSLLLLLLGLYMMDLLYMDLDMEPMKLLGMLPLLLKLL